MSREGMLSMRESDRAGMIGQVAVKRLRQREAAERLGLSVRQVKRLLARYRARAPSGLVSGRRGKPSNNAMAEAVRREAMELVRERYSDFGPTLAREKLVEVHGFRLSVETLRRVLVTTVNLQFLSIENCAHRIGDDGAPVHPVLPTGTRRRGMHGWEARMRLKYYLDQGVSKAELSRRFGISRRTIHHWIATEQLDRDLAAGDARPAPRRPGRPDDLGVHLILDNYGTHKTAKVKQWLLRHPRFHCHFKPTYSCWLNLVERFFASLTEHQLRRGSHRSVVALEKAIRGYLEIHNEQPKPFRWTKSADEMIESVNSVLKSINRTEHYFGSLLIVRR